VCKCGDTVNANYTLPGDLGPCPGHGLVIKRGIVLDCREFKIMGSGATTEQFGVFLAGKAGAEVSGVTVRACRISGFKRGIRLRDARGNAIVDNVSSTNGDFRTHVGYGIDLSGESKDNLLQGNTVQGNADEGIHVGRGSGGNKLTANVVTDNHRENLYVLAADGGVFLRNTLGGSGVNSLYLKDSSGNRFESNTFTAKTVRIIGDSHDNEFIGNTFSGAGVHFLPYAKDSRGQAPTNNRISGGVIQGVKECVRFTSTSGNVISDTTLKDCRTQVRSEAPTGKAENTILGAIPTAVTLSDGATLDVGWRVTVRVQNAAGKPLSGARVEAKDSGGGTAFSAVADDDGNVPPQVLIASTRTDSKTMGKTPHTLTTSKRGYRPDVRTISAKEHLKLTITLQPE
jgi:parallel beta-helix repeat protein